LACGLDEIRWPTSGTQVAGEPLSIRKVPLNKGAISFTNLTFAPGGHLFTANYASDTIYADSVGALLGRPPNVAIQVDPTSPSVSLSFTNLIGAPFSVLSSPDPSSPLSNWTRVGPATEFSPGQFQFFDTPATLDARRFYRVTSP